MTTISGAQFEILVDGKPRSYHSEVAVKDFQSGEVTVVIRGWDR
jgi:hypothetical protein